MKNSRLLILTTLLVSLFGACAKHPHSASQAAHAASSDSPVLAKRLPEGFVRFYGVRPAQALDVYARLTGASPDISPEVQKLQVGIYWTNQEGMTPSQVAAELEKVLRSQAGVVVRRADAAHITVTYDASGAHKP